METASLVIKVDSSGADRATRSLDKLDRAADSNTRAASKLGKAWGVAVGLISSAVIIGATRAFIRQADAFANMSARIGLVTDSSAELVKVQKQLFDLSQQTSSDLESTTDLYVKLAQSSDALRNNQSLLLRTTELVSKSLVVSGTEAAGAAATIRQFSQAMGAGALRGDEFISIMENAPRLAQAIADGMGVARGELREMAKDGKLTAEAVVAAIESQGDAIDREFGKMPLTVSRATQQVKNALGQMIGETDKAAGASAGLAQSIADLARTLESQEVKDGFATIITGIVNIIDFAARGTTAMVGLGQAVRDALVTDDKKSYLGLLSARGSIENDLHKLRNGGFYDKADLALGGESNRVSAFRDVDGNIAELERQLAIIDEMLVKRRALQVPVTVVTGKANFGGVTGKATGGWEGGDTTATTTRETTQATRELTQAEIEAAMVARSNAEIRREATDRLRDHEEAVKRGQAATDLLISDMEFELSLIGMSNIEREKAIALRYADANATAEQRAKIAGLAEELERAREAEGYINDLKGGMSDLFSTIGQGSDAAADAIDRMFDNLKRRAADALADRAINGLIEAFAALMTGGGWSGFASGFAKGWGGGKAGGGPVMAGKSYRVGEEGPEVVTFGQNGRVTPASALNASTGDVQVVLNITNNGQPVQAQKTGQRREGNKVIADIVLNTVREGFASGELDGSMRQFGVQRRGFR